MFFLGDTQSVTRVVFLLEPLWKTPLPCLFQIFEAFLGYRSFLLSSKPECNISKFLSVFSFVIKWLCHTSPCHHMTMTFYLPFIKTLWLLWALCYYSSRGLSPHLKVLNLVTSAKTLLLCRLTCNIFTGPFWETKGSRGGGEKRRELSRPTWEWMDQESLPGGGKHSRERLEDE